MLSLSALFDKCAGRRRPPRQRPIGSRLSVERLENRTVPALGFGSAFNLGSTLFDSGRDVALDAAGNLYVTGTFRGTVDFDPGPGTYPLTGYSDVFVWQLNGNGNFVWAGGMGGTGGDWGGGIAVDGSGNVYTTGYFYGTADFDPGPGTYNLTSAGEADLFVSKLVPTSPLRAAGVPVAREPADWLAPEQLRPILDEALARWAAAGVDTSALSNLDIVITDLGDDRLGLAAGHTIWLDDNAAGWGWFVDPTPWDDVEFPAAEDSPALGRIDLLTVLAHELGHLLGLDHDEDGVMAEMLAPGARTTPSEEPPDFLTSLATDDLFGPRKRNPR